MTRRAWDILVAGEVDAYDRALAALRDDTPAYWQQYLAERPTDDLAYAPTAEALKGWISRYWNEWHEEPIAALEHRDTIREQALGIAYAAEDLDVPARYEVHLDRKLERTLAILFRLRGKRGGSATLRGASKIGPDVVGDGRGRHGEARFSGEECSVDSMRPARRLGTELSTCGKRRRWTAEQKRQIVAEGMEPDVSAAMVARKHGISTGQFYAWRQQLLLRGALDAGADAVPNLAGLDAATSAPRVEPAIPAPPAPGTPTMAAAPVPPVQPDDRIGVTLQMVWQDGWTRIRR